jgi:hypothetical protein
MTLEQTFKGMRFLSSELTPAKIELTSIFSQDSSFATSFWEGSSTTVNEPVCIAISEVDNLKANSTEL